MPLPAFREDGWLPEGHHQTTWEEIEAPFGGEAGSHRARVFANLIRWRDAARAKGMAGLVILDGSFISTKAAPGDFDCIVVYDEPTVRLLAHDGEVRNLLNYSYCKTHFDADIFAFSVTSVRDYPTFCSTNGYDRDKITQQPKGVVEVSL